MKITGSLIGEVTGYSNVSPDFQCDVLALCNSSVPNSLSFIDDPKFLRELNNNSNVTAVIVTPELSDQIQPTKEILVSDDPRFIFFTMLNYIGEQGYQKRPSVIHPSAQIHPRAFVSETNVTIGKNTILEPNVTILPDVEIGDNCIIRAGTVIGAEGFEQKRTKRGILPVKHFGKVIIEDNVYIGALNAIAKGIFFRDTIVGESTKTDNLVHIAHCVQIGKRCLLPASCMIAGSVTIGDDVWIGPNSSISSGLTIDKSSFVTIGAVVTRNVPEGEMVSGNFAIPHKKFLRNLKKALE